MDFKHFELTEKSKTPSKPKTVAEKALGGGAHCDNSPFRYLPNFSTPPSRFAKIKNPFDSPLIDKLHLPICSPDMFAKSTPKKEDKFKWSICDISNLKPADIDENTVDQHVHMSDPSVESIIQDKISSFFNDQSVVPSPLNGEIVKMSLLKKSEEHNTPSRSRRKSVTNVSSQTALSFSSGMPSHVEEVLKPFCNFSEEIEDTNEEYQQENHIQETTFYNQLFNFDDVDSTSVESSPALSTGHSPLQFSPLRDIHVCDDNSLDDKDFIDCNLSPIKESTPADMRTRSSLSNVKQSRSSCRLFFSENMSVDPSDNIVPDMLDQLPAHSLTEEDGAGISSQDLLSNSTVNWDMEYKQVSLSSQDYEMYKMEISLPNTPNSRLFTSQRKRLSNSFIEHDCLRDVEERKQVSEGNQTPKSRVYSNGSDLGYHTGGITMNEDNTWSNSYLFSSTPTKFRTD